MICLTSEKSILQFIDIKSHACLTYASVSLSSQKTLFIARSYPTTVQVNLSKMTFSQRALLLFCVITSVYSRVEASTDGHAEFASPTQKTTNMGASDFMLGLYLKLAKPSGEVVNPGAIKGNRVHGFIDNGELPPLLETWANLQPKSDQFVARI